MQSAPPTALSPFHRWGSSAPTAVSGRVDSLVIGIRRARAVFRKNMDARVNKPAHEGGEAVLNERDEAIFQKRGARFGSSLPGEQSYITARHSTV
jgi:hypothetical protein